MTNEPRKNKTKLAFYTLSFWFQIFMQWHNLIQEKRKCINYKYKSGIINVGNQS